MCSLFRRISALLLLAAATWPVQANDQFWEHKDWKLYGERDAKGILHCNATTGGDGDPMFNVSARMGGDISIYYQEQTYRGMAPVLKKTDNIVFKLDDKAQTLYDDVQVFIDRDDDGIPRAIASMPGGYAAEVTRNMRRSSSVSVLREDPKSKKLVLIHKFSLAGFSAVFLKASEWCRFNADKLKTP